MRKIGKTARPGWLVSLPQTQSKKPEISAAQAVCDVVSTAPPLFFPESSLIDPYFGMIVGATSLGSTNAT